MGIEPTSSAWEAEVLPLNYTRNSTDCSGTWRKPGNSHAFGRQSHQAGIVRGGLVRRLRQGVSALTVVFFSWASLLPQPAAADPDREQAVQWAREGQLDRAITRLQALSAQSDDSRIRFDLIVILGWASRHAEAAAIWSRLPPDTPLPDYVRQALIRSLLETGQTERADELARNWLIASPADPAAHIAAGQVAEKRGLRFDALRHYGLAETRKPERPDLHQSIARLLADLGGTHGAVSQSLNPSLRELANRTATRLRWATQIPPAQPSARFERVDTVIAELDALIARVRAEPEPDRGLIAQILGDRAVAQVARERWQLALDDIEALRAGGASVPAYVRMAEGAALMGLRRPAAALEAYRLVLRESPDDLEARWGLFYAQVDTNDWAGAYQTVDAIAPDPVLRVGDTGQPQGNPDWLYARIVGAQVRSWAEEHAEAWQRLVVLADRAPGHAPLRAALAAVAATRGWPRRADDEIRIAEMLDDQNRGIQIEAAESAMRRARWDEVRTRLPLLLERYPNDSSVLRMQREATLRDRYELRIELGLRDEGEEARAAPGDNLSVSTRLYGPTRHDRWRVFTAAERATANTSGVYSAVRHRIGLGSQYRSADTTVETTVWQNTGSIQRLAASIDATTSPDDHWRWSASHSTFASDTPLRAIAGGITASATQLGTAYAWSELSSLSARIRMHDFSDTNRRQSAELSFSQRVYTAPEFKISLQPAVATSSNTRGDGPYFSPRRDHAVSVSALVERTVWRRDERMLTDRFTLGGGRYRQAGFESGTIAEASYEQTLQHSPALAFTYGLGLNRRLYDGLPEVAKFFFLQMISKF